MVRAQHGSQKVSLSGEWTNSVGAEGEPPLRHCNLVMVNARWMAIPTCMPQAGPSKQPGPLSLSCPSGRLTLFPTATLQPGSHPLQPPSQSLSLSRLPVLPQPAGTTHP